MEKETVPVVVGALASVRRDLRGTLTEFQELASASSKNHSYGNNRIFQSRQLFGTQGPWFGLGAAQAKQASQE